MDTDELYEMKRSRELEIEEAFFIWFYSIPDGFSSKTNCKIGDKYVIILSNIDKKCTMTLVIDIEMYDIVDEFVTTRDTDTIKMEDIMHYLIQKSGRKENK